MKKVMVVTSTRAEYGLLKPVITKINQSDDLQLILAVTGTHLVQKFGNTIDEIINDGFNIDYKADILKFDNTAKGVLDTISYTTKIFGDIIDTAKPDMVVVLGDRYEIFAVATAVSALGVPLAHISGGDVTIGAKDDFYRHCITKMANLHFPSCDDSYKRLLRLGEEKENVFNVGGLGNENIKNIKLMDIQKLSESLEFDLSKDFALITYHPETQKHTSPKQDMQNLFSALDTTNLNLIFTKANADAGGEEINAMIDEYCKENSGKAKAFFSLGLLRYLSSMKYAKIVVGNSSSGVVETPAFKVPCVNIGKRQEGRYIAKNVICCNSSFENISSSLQKGISNEFLAVAQTAQNPYDIGKNTSDEIVKHITEFLLENKSVIKKFYDGE